MFDPDVFSPAFDVVESQPAPQPDTELPLPEPSSRVNRIVRHQGGPLKITRIRKRER
jgi:hypothetical protein